MSGITFPLSFQQERIWMMMKLFPEQKVMWNIVRKRYLKGDFNFSAFQEAYRKLLARHAALRFAIKVTDFEPCVYQYDIDSCENRIDYVNLSDKGELDCEIALSAFIDTQRREYIFDVEKSLILVTVFTLRKDEFVIVVNLHHLIGDARSHDIFWKDLVQTYNLMQGDSKEVVAQPLPYGEYISAQRRSMGTESLAEKYWMEQLNDTGIPVTFPYDRRPLNERGFSSATETVNMDAKWIPALKSFATRSKVAPSSIFLTAFLLLLNKYSGQNDLVIGTYFSGRTFDNSVLKIKSVYNTIGMFVNTVALRTQMDAMSTVVNLIERVNLNYTKAYQYQNFPYQDLIRRLNPQRISTGRGLFNVGFNFIHQQDETKIYGIDVVETHYNESELFIETDLNLRVVELNGLYKLSIDYNTALYDQQTILRLLNSCDNIVQNILLRPTDAISSINYLADGDYKVITESFNTNISLNDGDSHLIEMIQRQWLLQPDQTAIIYGSERISYSELNLKSNGLARILVAAGVSKGDFVPVLIDHSVELIVSLLAIIKAGAVYVPLDTFWPEDRIQFLLRGMSAKCILVHAQTISLNGIQQVPIKVDFLELPSVIGFDHIRGTKDDDLYMMFTSGSTGKPKGVLISHAGFINRLLWMNGHFGNASANRVILTTRYVFDSSLWQILWPLINGGACVLLKGLLDYSIAEVCDIIENNRISTIDFVPSYFEIFAAQANTQRISQKLGSLKNIILGGESIIAATAIKFKRLLPDVRLTNLYGPTEATIGCIFYELKGTESDIIPIGRPISNMKAFIVDHNCKLQPIGVVGEIALSGVGVSRGYFNNAAATKLSFVPSPLPGDGICYKTGDLARLHNDGNIEFLGRKDDQISLHGLRIEPGEIEYYVTSFPNISKAVVSVMEITDNDIKVLCVHFTSAERVLISDLKLFLQSKLPRYLLPTQLIQIDRFHLSPSGKIDKSRLSIPFSVSNATGVANFTNSNELEEMLFEQWRDVLSLKSKIHGNEINFFDIGGHSLKAMEMILRVNNLFSVDITLAEFFRNPTISGLQDSINSSKLVRFTDIKIAAHQQNECGLSVQQQQMFILQYMELDQTMYNIPLCLEIEGSFSEESFSNSVKQVVKDNEILRTTFHIKSGNLIQLVHESIDIQVNYLPWSGAISGRDLVKPFDLGKGPLFRINIYPINEGRQVMFVDVHHIIFDGISANIFIEEILDHFSGQVIQKTPKIQYRDYVAWLQSDYFAARLKVQEAYWQRTFTGYVGQAGFAYKELIKMPTNLDAGYIRFTIDNKAMEYLRQIRSANNCTTFMILFSLYNILVAELTGGEDIVVGTPVSGRRHPDVQRIIGMFVNVVAIRNKINPLQKFTHFLSEVKANVINAFDNQDYPLEKIVRKLQINKNKERRPLFNAVLAFQNDYATVFEKNNIRIIRSDRIVGIPYKAKVDLSFWCKEECGSILIDVEYSRLVFTGEDIQAYFQAYVDMIERVYNYPDLLMATLTNSVGETKHLAFTTK